MNRVRWMVMHVSEGARGTAVTGSTGCIGNVSEIRMILLFH